MKNFFKNIFSKPEPQPEPQVEEKVVKKRKPRQKKVDIVPQLSAKEIATKNNEPYISITRMDINPTNINEGSFELDFNEKFVFDLIRAGYKLKQTDTDFDIVDRWFTDVCRNVALEVYEQKIADPQFRDLRTIQSKDIGNGRSEIS